MKKQLSHARRAYRMLRRLKGYPYREELQAGVNRGWFPVFVKYPVHPEPRYGYNGKAPNPYLHEVLAVRRDAYAAHLAALAAYESDLRAVSVAQPDDPEQPYWANPWFSGLDAAALYGFVAAEKPEIYLEIGSGNSTKFARRAIRDHELATRIVSVDPHPREEIDNLADEIVRAPLERADLSIFDRLTGSDILFFDGSHRCFMNSDVTVFFLEILPKLPPGVLIHIHDIHLPYDYPPERALHYESEQYLLAAMLLGGCTEYEVVLPNRFVLEDRELTDRFAGFLELDDPGRSTESSSFWIRKR